MHGNRHVVEGIRSEQYRNVRGSTCPAEPRLDQTRSYKDEGLAPAAQAVSAGAPINGCELVLYRTGTCTRFFLKLGSY
jgi:hypothetical protein